MENKTLNVYIYVGVVCSWLLFFFIFCTRVFLFLSQMEINKTNKNKFFVKKNWREYFDKHEQNSETES